MFTISTMDKGIVLQIPMKLEKKVIMVTNNLQIK